jgi:hypothetical protein
VVAQDLVLFAVFALIFSLLISFSLASNRGFNQDKGEYPDMWLILVGGIQERRVIARK